jgi:hypothetical protein
MWHFSRIWWIIKRIYIFMRGSVDWYTAGKLAAEKLSESASIEVLREKFKEIERVVMGTKSVVGEVRGRMTDFLHIHGQSLGRGKQDLLRHWSASVEVINFIYSLMRDRAYEARDQQFLLNINQVHAERLQELRAEYQLSVENDPSGDLGRTIGWTIEDSHLVHQKSLEALGTLTGQRLKRRR